jgi:peptidoglycan biosynthesis protein MviN/MurJ (putative lipid II flippase)
MAFDFWKPSGLWHPTMKTVGMLMLPTIFGAAVYQINILVGTLLASLLPEGSVSYLYYADRLVQFPLGILPRRPLRLFCPAFPGRLPMATTMVWETPSVMP